MKTAVPAGLFAEFPSGTNREIVSKNRESSFA